MFSLESDEMTALSPNDSLTFAFYVIFSNSIPNWTHFVNQASNPKTSFTKVVELGVLFENV